MDSLEELKNESPLRSPSLASTRMLESSRSIRTPPSVSRSPTGRSGRSSPGLMLEMSITEQIARKTRKSTVLDQKNALMILAIPDYDDYKIMQPYSCRSLSNKSKFVGGKDFITRHNPQEVTDFKMQYSRDVGNLGRQRSVLAPPNTLLTGMLSTSPTNGTSSSKSLKLAASNTLSSISSNQPQDETSKHEIWKRIFTSGEKPCWILTEYGISKLVGPEYSITTRLSLATAVGEPSPLTCRSPLRPRTPFESFTSRDSARIGFGVDLMDDKALGTLSRTVAYSPASRPASPPRSPYREPAISPPASREASHRPVGSPIPDSHTSEYGSDLTTLPPLSPYTSPSRMSPLKTRDIFRGEISTTATTTTSPTLQPFAMEVSPPGITLSHLAIGEVYIFPVRVRNVGSKQERFRVKHMSASAGGYAATIAEANYDRESARLAAGLATIITLTLSFSHRGQITGYLRVDTEGVGSCDVHIEGSVR